MSKTEDIKDIFTIFHDGTIEQANLASGDLQLIVSIEYLAQLIDDSYDRFELTLKEVESLMFKPWTGSTDPLTDWNIIFDLDLSIVSTLIDDEGRIVVHVTCGEAPEGSFEGGELIFHCQDIVISDQRKNLLTLNDLKSISKTYWNDHFGKR